MIHRGYGVDRWMGRNIKTDYRLLTALFRMLPEFVIAGEAKCGTTSLYRYLCRHPDIHSADMKEPRNFINYPDSRLHCRMHYPTLLTKVFHRIVRRRRLVTGEATAEYFSRRGVPEALVRTVPNVRVIVLLRNPARRALSDYEMLTNRGLVEEPFADIVRKSIRLLSNGDARKWMLDAGQVEHSTIRLIVRGIYVIPAKLWLECFGKERILFLKSEHFFTRPEEILHRAYDFLDVPRIAATDFPVMRQGAYDADKHASALMRLAEFYEPYNAKLYELLGTDLGW